MALSQRRSAGDAGISSRAALDDAVDCGMRCGSQVAERLLNEKRNCVRPVLRDGPKGSGALIGALVLNSIAQVAQSGEFGLLPLSHKLFARPLTELWSTSSDLSWPFH